MQCPNWKTLAPFSFWLEPTGVYFSWVLSFWVLGSFYLPPDSQVYWFSDPCLLDWKKAGKISLQLNAHKVTIKRNESLRVEFCTSDRIIGKFWGLMTFPTTLKYTLQVLISLAVGKVDSASFTLSGTPAPSFLLPEGSWNVSQVLMSDRGYVMPSLPCPGMDPSSSTEPDGLHRYPTLSFFLLF